MRTAGFAIYTLGPMMAVVARCQRGRNWSDIEKSRVKRNHVLVAHGIYCWAQRPIYAGDLLLLGLELALYKWAVLAVLRHSCRASANAMRTVREHLYKPLEIVVRSRTSQTF